MEPENDIPAAAATIEDSSPSSTPTIGEESYELLFRNGALANLKELAQIYNVPTSDLRQVVSKGIKLLNITKDAKSLTLEDKNGNRFIIDLKSL